MNHFFNDKKFELIFESYFRKTHAKFPFIKDDDINKKIFKNYYGMYDQPFVDLCHRAYKWLYTNYFDKNTLQHGSISYYRADFDIIHSNISKKFIKEFICFIKNIDESEYKVEDYITHSYTSPDSHFMFKTNTNYHSPEVEKFYFIDDNLAYVFLFLRYLIEVEDTDSIHYLSDLAIQLDFEEGKSKTILFKIQGQKDVKVLLETMKEIVKVHPFFDPKIHKIGYMNIDVLDIIETEKEVIIKEKE